MKSLPYPVHLFYLCTRMLKHAAEKRKFNYLNRLARESRAVFMQIKKSRQRIAPVAPLPSNA